MIPEVVENGKIISLVVAGTEILTEYFNEVKIVLSWEFRLKYVPRSPLKSEVSNVEITAEKCSAPKEKETMDLNLLSVGKLSVLSESFLFLGGERRAALFAQHSMAQFLKLMRREAVKSLWKPELYLSTSPFLYTDVDADPLSWKPKW